jgi:hypothetical protein
MHGAGAVPCGLRTSRPKPVHFLVIPMQRGGLAHLSAATESDKAILGHLLHVAQHVAKQGTLQVSASACGQHTVIDKALCTLDKSHLQ